MGARRFFWIIGVIWLGLACNLTAAAAPSRTPNSTPAGSAYAPATSAATEIPPTATPTALPSYERFLCQDKPSTVALLVDPGLMSGIRANLDRYETDLCADGFGVVERTLDFAAPPDVRTYLADLYARTGRTLEGAIFIGKVPFAYQSVRPESNASNPPPPAEEVISLQYYSDLDGEFSASPDYRSPGKHAFSFDRHDGDVDWEIWIGVLPFYRGDDAQTVDAWNRYFEKNHRYRTGQSSLPRSFLLITEHYTATTDAEQANFLNVLRTGEYAWTPFSNAPNAHLYFDGPTLSVQEGYEALSAGAADIAVTETHGNHTMSGRINIDWVESKPVGTVLFWTDGCSVGNLDYPENFLTSIVYSPTSEVLVAKGSTNDSGGLGTNREGFYGHNIAVRLAAGMNLGRAILGHVNVPLISPWAEGREFHFSMIILVGDPTLRFRG